MKLHKNNKHFQGFSKKKSAGRWGLCSFLGTETDLEEKGDVGSTLGERCSPSAWEAERESSELGHLTLPALLSWTPGGSVAGPPHWLLLARLHPGCNAHTPQAALTPSPTRLRLSCAPSAPRAEPSCARCHWAP